MDTQDAILDGRRRPDTPNPPVAGRTHYTSVTWRRSLIRNFLERDMPQLGRACVEGDAIAILVDADQRAREDEWQTARTKVRGS